MGGIQKRFLGIGNNRYLEHPGLSGAAGDMKAVARVLAVHYGFSIERSDLLVDATCKQMNEALERYARMDEFDTLVLYYAGHGYTDPFMGRPYWLPVDAGADQRERARWLDAGAIASTVLAKIPARHILVVSDSCFSGDILQVRDMGAERASGWEDSALRYRSREMLTSGMDTPVADRGLGGHSPFAFHLLDALEHHDEAWLDAAWLCDRVRRGVRGQSPQYGVLPLAGHQNGGACILRRVVPGKDAVSIRPSVQAEKVAGSGDLPQLTEDDGSPAEKKTPAGAPDRTGFARKADLYIVTKPQDADITVNGTIKGRSPLFLDDVGDAELLVVEARAGSMSARRELLLAGGLNEVQLTLEQEKGNLFIQTGERQAEVYIDGVRVRAVGYGLVRDLHAEEHEVELRLPGKKAVQRVSVPKDSTVRMVPEFVALSYPVEFDAQDGCPRTESAKQVVYGSEYGELPVPERTGHAFMGWWTAPKKGGAQVLASMVFTQVEPQTLYALWDAKSFIVQFDSQGGGIPNPAEKKVVYGSEYGKLPVPERTGHAFMGWWTAPKKGGAQVLASMVFTQVEPQTLYALWDANSYNVQFDSQGGGKPNPVAKQVVYGSEYGELPVPERAGHTFLGWWTAPKKGGAQVLASAVFTLSGPQTVYAAWEANSYTVQFDSQGGGIPNPAEKKVVYGSEYGELPVPERTGHAFMGWWTAPKKGGAQVLASMVFTQVEPQTLYALWDAKSFIVQFDSQGGGIPNPAAKQVVYGSEYGELPVPKVTGHVFLGWWTGPGGSGTQVLASMVCTQIEPQTLYAAWEANSYTVQFDSQGGVDVDLVSKQVVFGSEYGELPVPERTGYTFLGWWTGPGGEGFKVEPGTIMEIAADFVLFAMWTMLPATVMKTKLKKHSGMIIGAIVLTLLAIGIPWNGIFGSMNAGTTTASSASFSIPMALVEGGTFQMGSNSGDSDEEPVHTVSVGSFYLGTYEVTQDLYQQVMGSNPSYFKGMRLPVDNVSWYDAVAFCNALSRKDGLEQVYTINGTTVSCDWGKSGYRLPTEAEWEYAARGGSKSKGYTYAGSSTAGDVAWYTDNSGSKTQIVGGKRANELGLYDMSGNVWEWCWDWYGGYSASAATNPRGPSSGSSRVLRGGSWYDSAEAVRTAYRFSDVPSYRYFSIGFRVSAPVV